MSEIIENENENEVETETETETGYVRVKRVYATTEDEITLIVEPIDGAIPENGIKMQDGTYRVVWSMKHVKDLIREYVVADVTHSYITEGEPLPVSATIFGIYFYGDTVLNGILSLGSDAPPPPSDDPLG